MVTRSGGAARLEERAKDVDALAERILAGLAPLAFETARSAADRDEALRMRYEVMVELGWVEPGDYADGRASDEYDDGATFVLCRDGDDLLGSMRVVLPRADRPLPVEREFGIGVRAAGGVFEAGRLVVPRRHRPGRSHVILAGLCARAWLEARALGCVAVVSTATADVIELYRGLGMRIVVLGPARSYWGEERVPIEIRGTEEHSTRAWVADTERRPPDTA